MIFCFTPKNSPHDPLTDGSEISDITVLFSIVNYLQLLVLSLFYTLGNLFPTQKLSDDVIHFRSISEGDQGPIFPCKVGMH